MGVQNLKMSEIALCGVGRRVGVEGAEEGLGGWGLGAMRYG